MILLLVGVLALVVNPPAPPGIAAFAPQASKQITKAPLNQSSSAGDGNGACVPGQPCDYQATTTTTIAATQKLLRTGVPSALQCYKWPDGTVTQTFDPQSPPCVAGWDDAKGNGGATSPGVTATEIRIALPKADGAITIWPIAQPLVDFFNTRYQFYGRKIRLIPFSSQQATSQSSAQYLNDPSRQRADAAQVTQMGVFGALDFVDPISYAWSLPAYRDVLTRNKIISINGGEMTPYGTAAGMAAHAPYEWTYYNTIDSLLNAYGNMTCTQLVGKPATHAPDPALRSVTRKFAILAPTDDQLGGPIPGLSALVAKLQACGANNPKVVRFKNGNGEVAPNQAAMKDLKDSGVTTVMFFPWTGSETSSNPMDKAKAVDFRPEWLTMGWNNYLTHSQLNAPTDETAGMFGVAVWNKMPPLEQEPFYRAWIAAGGDPGVINSGGLPGGRAYYQELVMLAAGIQMAGPNLTPESFAKGLHETKFPNPGAGVAPFYQGTVGFPSGATAMVQDYVPFWLDNRWPGKEVAASKNVNTSRGTCYPDLGTRYLDDKWPAADGFYGTPACR